jgi:hypothetical protein
MEFCLDLTRFFFLPFVPAFVSGFLKRIHDSGDDEPLRKHGREAYEATLAKYHPWLVRKAVHVAVYALPTRKNLLNIIAGDTRERHEHCIQLATPVVARLEEIFDKVEKLYGENKLLELP